MTALDDVRAAPIHGSRRKLRDAVRTQDITDASDAALAVAIGRFREDALAEAYRRHAGAVFALASRLLPSRATAEEIVQEVFLRLWNSPDRFDPARGSMRAFLLAQTHGMSIDVIRSDTARARREEKDGRRTAEAGYDVEREVWDLAVAEHVRVALATLPENERRAIELAYFHGRTYREVAAILEEPEGTVKSRIRSGMKRLRGALTEAGVGND
ncbi:MAG: sigma-70 family RNA polymerase sigma factor [Acidimicrobiia bacterium]